MVFVVCKEVDASAPLQCDSRHFKAQRAKVTWCVTTADVQLESNDVAAAGQFKKGRQEIAPKV